MEIRLRLDPGLEAMVTLPDDVPQAFRERIVEVIRTELVHLGQLRGVVPTVEVETRAEHPVFVRDENDGWLCRHCGLAQAAAYHHQDHPRHHQFERWLPGGGDRA